MTDVEGGGESRSETLRVRAAVVVAVCGIAVGVHVA